MMNTPISETQKKELLEPTTPPIVRRDVIKLSVARSLQERRIYLYLEVLLSAGSAYLLECNVVLKRQGNIIGRIPATIADFTNQTPNQSVESYFNSGGSPVGDSMSIRLAQPFTSTKSVVVQPIRVNAEVDEVTLDVVNVIAFGNTVFTGWRAFLACLSAKV